MPSQQPLLFSPLTLRSVTFRNRIGVSPMCQYSSVDGLRQRLAPGASRQPRRGRRRAGDHRSDRRGRPRAASARRTPGIWNDEHAAELLARIAAFIARAGRRARHPAGARRPQGVDAAPVGRRRPASPPAEGGWQTVAPSRRPVRRGLPDARASSTTDEIARRRRRPSRAAARRADARRLRGRRDPRRPRLPAARVPLAAVATGAPTATAAASRTASGLLLEVVDAVRARLAGPTAALRADLRDRLGRRAAGTVDESVALARLLARARRRPDRLLLGRQRRRRRRSRRARLPSAVRPTRSARGAASPPPPSASSPSPRRPTRSCARVRPTWSCSARELLRDPYWPLRAAQRLGAPLPYWPVQYHRARARKLDSARARLHPREWEETTMILPIGAYGDPVLRQRGPRGDQA